MKRLSETEATALGFAVKKDKDGREKALYYLNDEKLSILENTSESKTVPNNYEEKPFFMSAWCSKKGRILTEKEYCIKYGMDPDAVQSSKFLPFHYSGVPTYNIVFKPVIKGAFMDIEKVREVVAERISKAVRPITPRIKGQRTGVVKMADLHLGAEIEKLLRTSDFNIEILRAMLHRAARIINRFKYDLVHIHLLGDLIESFTGLNHKNSWKGLNKNLIGAEAVIVAVEVLENDFLNRIENLGSVKIIAGNHDRVTSDAKEDTQGDAAKLISWGLNLRGFDTEFDPKVLTHVVDGIAHILAHGHLSMTKDTKSMCWDYGKQGLFNLLCMGHLHSVIKLLSENQKKKFKITKDDAIDSRSMYCSSFFTGNDFSESIGYTSTGGFHIVEDNGFGRPNIYDFAF